MDDVIVRIVPSPEELQIVGRQNHGSWKCLEVGCSYEALNSCILGLHKSQVHNFRSKHRKGIENVHYHCPVSGCYFNPQSERYFKNMDTLRTHYMKIHSEKKFLCTKCNKTFGLERDCHRHEADCGKNFCCDDCGKVYTNMSALRGHCDYNGHHSLAQKTKTKTLKETPSKPINVLSKTKGKLSTVTKSAPPFILPKQILPKTAPSQMHSLHIQTDASGGQFFISKLASDNFTSQGVQTVERVSMTRSAGIQTTCEFLPLYRSHVAPNQTERLSTGIQTVFPISPSLNNSLRVAQTQTRASILQTAMARASIPVVNVCKEAQKSLCGHKRKRKASVSCTTGSQTFCPKIAVDSRQRNHEVHQDSNLSYLRDLAVCSREVQNGLNESLDFMSTMSTQTSLSCVSGDIFPKLYNTELGIQLQDCHTQTLGDVLSRGQSDDDYMDQSIVPRSFIHNSDQITQTKSYNLSIDRNTQTGRMSSCLNDNDEPFEFLSIQDSQTQTVCGPLSPGFSQGQSPMFDPTATQSQVQSTTCEELLDLSDRRLSNFSKADLSLGNDSGIYFLLGDISEKCMRTSQSTNDLTDLLMEVINSNISCADDCSLSGEGSKNPDDFTLSGKGSKNPDDCSLSGEVTKNPGQSTATGSRIYGNCENGDKKSGLPVASMETQTFGNLGMDSMTQTIEDLGWDMSTQTIEDLGWDMSTQTVDYLLTDMMTQTGDDFLEFLTNDTHTQTINDFCMDLVTEECLKTCGCSRTSTLDNVKQTNLGGLFGDHVSTQTIWDTEDQTLDLQSSSFAASAHSSFMDHAEEAGVKPGLYLEKEHSTSRDLISCGEVSNIQGRWENALTPQAQVPSDFVRDTETTETQTMYDPLFNYLSREDTLSFNCRGKVKYLESSHTQTTQDPMLPSVGSDDEPGPFLFSQKETSETQTGTDFHFPAGRETAECQTPWDNYLNSIETQTQKADFF